MPKRLTPRGEAAPPVEPIVTGATLPPKEAAAKKKPAPRTPKVTDSGVRYVRNLHHMQARVTLTTGRAIQLAPRGQREDIDVVNAEEQQDPKFLANRDLVFEVITAEQAKQIIYKQQTNSRQAEHPAWQHLRNSQGDPYESRVTKVEEVFERQGVVVGQVADTGAGRFTDKNSEVMRPAGGAPLITTVPGSAGHPATEYMQQGPTTTTPTTISAEDYREFLLWKEFREARATQKAAEELPEG